jgi:hypothetical protein
MVINPRYLITNSSDLSNQIAWLSHIIPVTWRDKASDSSVPALPGTGRHLVEPEVSVS